MGNIVKKQHFIPRFLLKRFVDKNNNLNILFNRSDKDTIKYNPKSSTFDNDIFSEDYLYEKSDLETNKIEGMLSRMENDFSRVLSKIENHYINNEGTNEIELSSLEIMQIIIFSEVSQIRTKTLQERAENQEGDGLFNSKYKEDDSKKIREKINSDIEKMLRIHFDAVKYLKDKKRYKTESKKIRELWNDNLVYSLKMFYSSDDSSFLLSDNASASQIISPFLDSVDILTIGAATRNILFTTLPFYQLLVSNGSDDFIIKSNNKLHYSDNSYFLNDIGLFYDMNRFNTKKLPSSFKRSSGFKYLLKVEKLTNKQVAIINAFIINQSRNFIIFNNYNDYLEAQKFEEATGMRRIEDINKNRESYFN